MTETVDPTASTAPGEAEEPADQVEAGRPVLDEAEQVDREEAGPEADEQAGEEPEEDHSISTLLGRAGQDVGRLVACEAQLETARNVPEVRRAARHLVGGLVAAVAFLSAFVFLNVAAYGGLRTSMSDWAAALVLAAIWIVAGGALGFGVLEHLRKLPWWALFSTPSAQDVARLERERNDAAATAWATLSRLGPAITIEIATAAIPGAGDIAGGVLESSEEVVETITEVLPGGGVVNQIWDVALMPGRFGLRVATTVFRRETPAG